MHLVTQFLSHSFLQPAPLSVAYTRLQRNVRTYDATDNQLFPKHGETAELFRL